MVAARGAVFRIDDRFLRTRGTSRDQRERLETMPDDDISRRMREDWNARAREDAGYFVAFGRRYSDDVQFFATATEVINRLEWVLSRVPLAERGNWRALEVGCGPGRLMRPMSRHFVEIHGVDVSDEMIALSKEKLADIPNARTYVTDGSTLPMFDDESFEFVYSYAVFQHIPAREVIVSYLREIHRVMKTGGLAVLHFNGLINRLAPIDTWDGVRFSSNEVLEFAGFNDFQVLALEGAGTQYMWSTWRKRPTGWIAAQKDRTDTPEVRVRRITNANSSEPVAPCRGRFASISIWVENLPDDIGLHHLQVMVGNSLGTVCFIGPRDYAGMQQINVILPQLEATGLLPVEILWLGRPIAPTAVLRVIPPRAVGAAHPLDHGRDQPGCRRIASGNALCEGDCRRGRPPGRGGCVDRRDAPDRARILLHRSASAGRFELNFRLCPMKSRRAPSTLT